MFFRPGIRRSQNNSFHVRFNHFFFNYRIMTIIRSKFVPYLHRSAPFGRGKTKLARCHSFYINSLAADPSY